MVYPIIDSDIFQTNKMSFTLYLWIQIPLTIALVCLVIYQHRLYYKQKKLIKEMIERDMYGLNDDDPKERQKQNIEKTELEISEDLLKWREERRQFNRQWNNAFPPKIWPW